MKCPVHWCHHGVPSALVSSWSARCTAVMDYLKPPLPPGTFHGSQGPQNPSHRGSQPPPPPPPDHYGAQRHRDRSNEPPDKRGRYDQSAGGSALDFIKQEYGGEAESQEQFQERKVEAWQAFSAEQFPPAQQIATSQLQEQFAGRGLIAVGAQHFLGQLQPGQGLLGEYGSQQNEQLAAIAYGAQTAFVGGFNPPVATIKQEPTEPVQQPWQGQNRGQNQPSGQSNRGQQNRPNPNFAPDQNRNQGQGGRPNSGFGGQRNPTPPSSRANQFGSQPPPSFQQRNVGSPGGGNRNQNFPGQGNQQNGEQNRFGGKQNQFDNDQNQDQQNSELLDDKQIKRERRRPSKWDTPEGMKDGENAPSEAGQQDFQNALSNLRNKLAEQEASNTNQSQDDSKPPPIIEPENQGFNSGAPPGGPQGSPQGGPQGGPHGGPQGGPQGSPQGAPQGGPHGDPQGGPRGGPHGGPQGGPQGGSQGGPHKGGGPGMMGSGSGPRGPPQRGMNPRGPPGNFNGPPPFGQPGPPRGPRGPGMDGPPFARGRGGFKERGPPGNRGPLPMRPFGPRGDGGDGPRGPGGPGPGWNPRPGGPRGFNPRMGGPGGPRGPFGPPGRFNRPPMGQQRWQRPPH